jgi:2',3'-cyclic-nucleotide 2'-phosphodiesterase (5'-nucleotidase family)
MKRKISFFRLSAVAALMIMMSLGTLSAASDIMQHEGAAPNQPDNTQVNNIGNATGNQFTFAPERLKDKTDDGIELESETGARSVMIQRYKALAKGTVNIFILNTGDIHESSARLAHISQYVINMRALHPGRVVLLDAGDMLTHFRRVSPESDWQGQHDQMYGWAESMQYDAMVFGNHDFVASVKTTQQLIGTYHLPYVCANLQHPDLSVPQFKIVSRTITLSDGSSIAVKIGVVGLSDPNHVDYHHPDDADKSNLTVHPVYNNTIKALIQAVEAQADFIVLLSHNGDNDDRNSVAALPGDKTHVIVGGHSHRVLVERPNGRSLIKSGVYGHYTGSTMVEWNPNTRAVVKVTARNEPM